MFTFFYVHFNKQLPNFKNENTIGMLFVNYLYLVFFNLGFISSGWASLVAQMVKQNLPAMQETWVESLSEKDPWRREWQPTPVFWPREFHREGSLKGYSPWGYKELDTTDLLLVTHGSF